MATTTESPSLAPGYVLGVVVGQAKAQSNDEWNAAVEKVWPEFIAILESNPGYKGAYAAWNPDKPGEVSIIGIWQSMEHRLAYEAKSAPQIRELFNALISNPQRYKVVVSRAAAIV